jgi:hypothetical protein
MSIREQIEIINAAKTNINKVLKNTFDILARDLFGEKYLSWQFLTANEDGLYDTEDDCITFATFREDGYGYKEWGPSAKIPFAIVDNGNVAEWAAKEKIHRESVIEDKRATDEAAEIARLEGRRRIFRANI